MINDPAETITVCFTAVSVGKTKRRLMKITSIAKTIFCLALLLCWGTCAPTMREAAASGHELEEVGFVFHTISWGMVRGQTARFTVVNPNAPDRGNTSNGQA